MSNPPSHSDDGPGAICGAGTLLGEIKDKLVRTKTQWAEEGRFLPGDPARKEPPTGGGRRLPPGQQETRDFPVLDLGVQPNLSPRDWTLSVAGQVDNPIRWGWDDFQAQPQVDITSDIHCVTTWSRYDNRWQGVSMAHFLSVVRPKATARFVMVHSYDGYTTNLSLERLSSADVVLAHAWQGKPLPREHGGPVRLVVPKVYFWKSAKWIKHITFLDRDQPGYWEARGYHMDGDPWKEQRYD